MKGRALLAGGLAVVTLALVACGGEGGANQTASPAGPADPRAGVNFDPAFFSAEITNRYFPWASVCRTVLEGEEEVDGRRIKIREEAVRGNQSINISGALTTHIEVLSYSDGELAERTKDYFAQGKDGWVYYFGEDVDEFEEGKVLHTGSWKVGWNETEPQKFVPPFPAQGGERFNQESVPDVAVEEVEVVAIDETVDTPAETFAQSLHWKEHDPISGTDAEKWLAPDVGMVKETFKEGYLLLTEFSQECPSGGQ